MRMGDTMAKVQKSEAEWRDELTPEQFRVLRKHGTEPSHTSALNHIDEPGSFSCAGCGQSLFARTRNTKAAPVGRVLCTGQ